MSKIHYNKLIRDRIPEIIAASGKTCEVQVMLPDEFEAKLLEKLIEESSEIQTADHDHLTTEIADLLEVIDTLLDLKAISMQAVRAEQLYRREQRGGFQKKLKLVWSE